MDRKRETEEYRRACLHRSGIDRAQAEARRDMTLAEREASARLECERDGLDPDAPHVDDHGNTMVCGPDGELFPNHEFYDLVLAGFADRPVKTRAPN